MQINVEAANAQARQARMTASRLRDINTFLRSYHADLHQAWSGQEMIAINNAISDIMGRISRTAVDLESAGSSIANSAQALRRADELAARSN